MNREIKFRAWDSVNRKLYLDELESIAFAKSGIPANATISGFSRPLMAIGDDPQLVLMQYTGLEDKNGKEIYEGDIIGYWGGNPNGAKWIVGWDDNKSGWAAIYGEDERTVSGVSVAHQPAFKLSKKLCEKKEIIGNLYENSELLAD